MRAVFHEFLEARQVGQVVAVAEQDDAVRLAAVLVVLVPVARHLLKGDQQVVAAIGAGARDRAEHRQEKGIDLRFIGSRILEQEQREGVGMLEAQVRGVLVDLVVQLLRDGFDAPARLEADHRAAAQGTRDGGLGHARQVGDVEGRGLALHSL